MNSDMLLNRIRMAQQGLIGVHKKLYTLEHLLPSPDPAQFAETAKSAALLSERSTASTVQSVSTGIGLCAQRCHQRVGQPVASVSV